MKFNAPTKSIHPNLIFALRSVTKASAIFTMAAIILTGPIALAENLLPTVPIKKSSGVNSASAAKMPPPTAPPTQPAEPAAISTVNSDKTALSTTTSSEPSSAIPARREFPLNPNVNPCQDFHQYVCSLPEASFKLRDDRSSHIFSFSDSRERLLDAKMTFMKNLPKEKKLPPRALQIKDYYMGCMNTKARAEEERDKIAKVKKELSRINNASDFMKYLNAKTFDGEANLFYFYNSPNVDNPLKLDAAFGANLMDLPDHNYYEKPEVMAAYRDLVVKFFKTAPPDLSDEAALDKATQQVQLQQDFVKIYPVAAVRRQRWSEKRNMSQSDFLKKYPKLQAEVYLKRLPKSTLVSVPIPESLDFINSRMTDVNLPLFKDFYLMQVGTGLMDEAYPEFFKAQFDFEKNFFGGSQVRSDLQERCTNAVSRNFSLELDQILIDRLFPGFKDKKVQELAAKIRSSIVAGLERNTWLSPAAKVEAMKKIKTARLQLVRPQNDREWDFLPVQKYSKKLYLGNSAIHQRARLQKTFEELRHEANQDAWGMAPLTVNAYYSPNENKFVLPIGILQYPFFDDKGDQIENFGAIGAVMGHELGHSIDDQGSKYDASGKLHQWMTMQDLAEFSKRGQKMIDQFNAVGHNGLLTQGENVADLVGLSFAYHAAFPESGATEADQKKFFISYARAWCSVQRPDYVQKLLKTDPHALGSARINEQVKHQPAFAAAFKCKPGDAMVRSDAERVQIW